MPFYEHVFLARQDLGPQQVEEFTNQYKAVVEGLGGKVAKTEYWGIKSLSYRIRYLTVRVDELEEGPSAMMRKADRDRERDDRPGGRGFGDRGGDRGGFRDRDRDRERRPAPEGDEQTTEE